MNIPSPDEFKKACRNLGQDLGYEKPPLALMAQVALIGIERPERAVIKAFLDELLSGTYTAEQLKEFWWSTPADIYFHEGQDLITFLTMLRDEVTKAS
jgi:hypothetical protein